MSEDQDEMLPMDLEAVPAESIVHEDEDVLISRIYTQAQDILEAIRSVSSNSKEERQEPTFPMIRTAELVGRSASNIREAENAGRLPEPDRSDNGRRVNYSLSAINHMREVFGTMKRRGEGERTPVIAVQNFKGGVGKSTLAVNLAQYLAIQGYRVCLVDCDSQATTTSMFGYRPDMDLDAYDDTLYGYIHDGLPHVPDRMIKDTHFPGLKLIPANLDLYLSEYELANAIATKKEVARQTLNRINDAMQDISDRFDIIIMDPPPALGMIALGVLAASNAMVIPVPPTVVDFSSTASFVGMLKETMIQLNNYRSKPVFNFVRLVASKTNENKGMHKQVLHVMQEMFGRSMLNATLKDSAEIDNASAMFKTVYELEKPISKRDVHERCIASLNAVCAEVEIEIRKMWPSHHAALRAEGVIV
jgi:chromosome partitioning protein